MSNKPITLTSANFSSEVLKSTQPVVVDFWAPWCGPCRSIAPLLERFANRYGGRVKVAKLNVDDWPELAQRYRISGIPTLLSFAQGKVAGEMLGFRGISELERMFDDLGVASQSAAQ